MHLQGCEHGVEQPVPLPPGGAGLGLADAHRGPLSSPTVCAPPSLHLGPKQRSSRGRSWSPLLALDLGILFPGVRGPGGAHTFSFLHLLSDTRLYLAEVPEGLLGSCGILEAFFSFCWLYTGEVSGAMPQPPLGGKTGAGGLSGTLTLQW